MDEIIESYVADGEIFIKENNKKYLKSFAILVENTLFAANFADTTCIRRIKK